ncbi:MAG TPA: alpha-amylase family glycosyl hydrolase [Anaerolineaceae bacterium]|mgnify:CR=1 FL=1|nr:alpha-amylase family glycosyl hydrolase [Anaerolineaceae bacterium]HPN52219.1 alpha-amylase family glycosyl hydrolase [Anaerolineaceae bacterium]
MREFHIARKTRDRYQLDQSLFSIRGEVIMANFHAVRLFAQKINQKRDLVNFPEQAVRAGQINAMGMIDEIMHLVVGLYVKQERPTLTADALNWLDEKLGREAVDKALLRFSDEFPTTEVYQQQISAAAYLAGETDGTPNRQVALEELMMLWLANVNPARSPFLEFFDDSNLRKETPYLSVITQIKSFLDTQPPFGPEKQNLLDMLHSPAEAVPYSLSGQLEFIRERWGVLLGKYLYRILGSLDLLKEEEMLRFGPGAGGGPVPIPTFGRLGAGAAGAEGGEVEAFSPDREWMPRLVMIAKNAFVWLDQLSKTYKREIRHLDQIPDEELDTLAQRGFSGLWLIGLWERSKASQAIKVMCGNPDAVASAYSLAGYDIANDLGGYQAYTNLRDRAWLRGIRLASDMVPNHMGIDSNWVIEHPDWFLSLDYSPFPSYTFNGPDLSPDSRVSINLEDHYYSRSDAAVVFKRYDHQTGREQYIYHGNDGTSMPWNDTAQLNYLNPAVREAVIQTILHVARMFPIIRFDAAMTLAKKHFQRLWFPEPGTGGAIPTRAEFGLTKDRFDAAFPVEFWREVVDRVAKEAPDTLLLAEAFWLMEGYFVRTLGMHRVYNSAFMNLLRNEDNAQYRLVMKNTLEFDPEILKRYVNFMNNPDERTAVDQFGKGDKYFGICTLMATMPGLPMFGHGQVEGFTEKYGMEYRRAYWEETPDRWLIERHNREIFPLLHRRPVFSGVDHFLLYDFASVEGRINEDVFAYSNGIGSERALVVYHNKFGSTRGWVKNSVNYSVKEGNDRRILSRTLAEGLNLHNDPNHFCILREHNTGLEYLRASRELTEQGLYLELDAYKTFVFVDIREVQDDDHHRYAQLAAYLGGRGVPSVEEALQVLFLAPVHEPFRQLVNGAMFSRLYAARLADPEQLVDSGLVDELSGKMAQLLRQVKNYVGGSGDDMAVARQLRRDLESVLSLPVLIGQYPLPGSRSYSAALEYLLTPMENNRLAWGTLFGWLFVHNLGRVLKVEGYEEQSRSWMDEWRLGPILAEALMGMDIPRDQAWQAVHLIKVLVSYQNWFKGKSAMPVLSIVENYLMDEEIRHIIGVNRYKDVLWFNKEAFENTLWWMMLLAVLAASSRSDKSASQMIEEIIACHDVIKDLMAAEEQSDYQLEKLMDALH